MAVFEPSRGLTLKFVSRWHSYLKSIARRFLTVWTVKASQHVSTISWIFRQNCHFSVIFSAWIIGLSKSILDFVNRKNPIEIRRTFHRRHWNYVVSNRNVFDGYRSKSRHAEYQMPICLRVKARCPFHSVMAGWDSISLWYLKLEPKPDVHAVVSQSAESQFLLVLKLETEPRFPRDFLQLVEGQFLLLFRARVWNDPDLQGISRSCLKVNFFFCLEWEFETNPDLQGISRSCWRSISFSV
jgi:hypothetical protein